MNNKDKRKELFHHASLYNFLIILLLLIFLFIGTFGIISSMVLLVRLFTNIDNSFLRDFNIGIDTIALLIFISWAVGSARWLANFITSCIFHQL